MSNDFERGLRQAVLVAMRQLMRAARALEQPTTPRAPRLRPRVFVLLERPRERWTWPALDPLGQPRWSWVQQWQRDQRQWAPGPQVPGEHFARWLPARCGYQPRRVRAALWRLALAAAWCQRRLAGRARAVERLQREQAGRPFPPGWRPEWWEALRPLRELVLRLALSYLPQAPATAPVPLAGGLCWRPREAPLHLHDLATGRALRLQAYLLSPLAWPPRLGEAEYELVLWQLFWLAAWARHGGRTPFALPPYPGLAAFQRQLARLGLIPSAALSATD